MKEHVCHENHDYCACDGWGLEPNEDCFKHGSGPWPPRCDVCGRLLPWSVRERPQVSEGRG